jgi:hypothetical protein
MRWSDVADDPADTFVAAFSARSWSDGPRPEDRVADAVVVDASGERG